MPETQKPKASTNKPAFDEPYLHDLSADELRDRFYAVRKVALDSLDGQAISPFLRELRRGKLHDIEYSLWAGMQLYALLIGGAVPVLHTEEERLKKLGVDQDFEVTGTYPDSDHQSRQEYFAESEMLRIFYVAAARDILSSSYSTLNRS